MKLSDPIQLPSLPSGLASLLNLHIAGVAALVVLNFALLTQLVLAWHDLGAGRQDEIQQKELQLAQLRAQTARLNGLPEKVEGSRKQADKFYADRIASNDSTMAEELGNLAAKNNVRLTRAGYTSTPALEGLAEVRIDANLAGEYSGVMHFVNGLERDKIFFLINGVTLTGQQGGQVNLRLRLTTYLHAADAKNLPETNEEKSAPTEPATRPVAGTSPGERQ